MNTTNIKWNHLNILLIAYGFFLIPLYCTNFPKQGTWNWFWGVKTSIIKTKGMLCLCEFCFILFTRLFQREAKIPIATLLVFFMVSLYRIFGSGINIPGWAQWSNFIFLALILVFFVKEKQDCDIEKQPKEKEV